MEVKIKLKIKDVEIELNRKEAKELKDILNDLVGREKEYIPYPEPYPVYPNPWYPVYDKWEITWGMTTDNKTQSECNEYTICYK